MQVKDLKTGKYYYYTAGAEWVDVKYKHKMVNGYMFSYGGEDKVLTESNVSQYITEK